MNISDLRGYGWDQLFGDEDGGPYSDVKLTDIAELLGAEEGENDGPDWICWGRLHDGRYFVARAGCDYTGFDCRGGGSSEIGSTRLHVVQFCMSDSERQRFKIDLEAERNASVEPSKPVEKPIFDKTYRIRINVDPLDRRQYQWAIHDGIGGCLGDGVAPTLTVAKGLARLKLEDLFNMNARDAILEYI